MKKLLLLVFILGFTVNIHAYQEERNISKKTQIADSLLQEKAYQLSARSWKEIIQLTSSQDLQSSFYKSKLFFCEAKLLQSDGDYTNAIKKYRNAQQLLNTHSSSENNQYKIEVYSGLYHSLAYSGDWKTALEKGNEGLNLFTTKIDKKIRADYIYDLGYINDRLDNYPEAIELYQQSIALYETFDENKNFDLGLAYHNLATVYRKFGFFSERIKSFEKAQKYWEKDPDINPTYLITLYGNMMKLYMEYGDATKTNKMFSALNTVPNTKLQPGDIVNKLRVNVIYYTFSKQLAKAEKQLEEFTSFFSALTPKEKKLYSHHYLMTLIDLGDEYVLEKLNYKANKTLQHALHISKVYQQPYYKMLTYSSQTKLAANNKEYEKAISYLDKSLIINNTTPIGLVNVVNILIKKANVQLKQNCIAEANNTIQQALTALTEKKITTPNEVTIETFKQQHSSFFVMALKNAAAFYQEMYSQTQQKEDAQHARYLYELAAEVFGLYYQNGEYNTNLNFYNKSINEGIYEMHTALKIPLSEKVLAKIQANNSQVLRNEFERKHFQFLAVEENMLSQRNLLQFQLKKLQDNKAEKKLQKKLQDTIQKLDTAISAKDPILQSFYKEDINLQKIQHHLTEEELLVKYFLGNHFCYAIVISQNNIQLFRLAETDTLKRKLTTFYKTLQNPQKDALLQSQELYSHLIQPLEKELSRYKTLTVIPDDELHYLPFEALEGEGSLLNSHKIQYANSLALWYFLKKNPHQPHNDKNLLVAFAPRYTSKEDNGANLRGNRFKEIEGARIEAEKISATLKGDLFVDDNASIENFMDHTNTYKIYHLAMHAVLNENEHTQSSLVFHNNDFFNFSSLYSMYFPADLVVLSACNTGVGKLAAGEGLLSLSRALTYSGVRSSVYSLWEVPDKETSEIMVSFYQYLKNGKDKATALSYAKRDFKQNNPMKAHPYYWAGFVINGDTVPVATGNTNLIGYLLAGGIIFGLGMFFYHRKKKIGKSI